jgi:hypothetical protein
MSCRTSAPSPNRLEIISLATLLPHISWPYDAQRLGTSVQFGFAYTNFISKEPDAHSLERRDPHETVQEGNRSHKLHLRKQAAVVFDIFVHVLVVLNKAKGLGHGQRCDDIQGEVLNGLCKVESAIGGGTGEIFAFDEVD